MMKATPLAAIAAVLLCVLCPARRSQELETSTGAEHYARAKDPKWYAKQIVPLRQELIDIDQQIHDILQARQGDARGTTGAVNLDKAPEGVDTQADLSLLQQRRTHVLQRISEIEDEARRNEVAPGAVRAAEGSVGEPGTSSDANDEAQIDTPEITETKEALRQQREHLERAKNEANLLERELNLDTHTVYSNAEYAAQK